MQRSKKYILFVLIIAMITMACGLFSRSKSDDTASTELLEEAQSSVQHSGPASQEEEVYEYEAEEEEAFESEMGAPSSPPVSSNAPKFFRDDFDGEMNKSDWFTEYSYFVDEDVEEDDDEYTPTYAIEQRRGALRFEIESPYLYLYRFYAPHAYDDVRIDFEVENKGVNTNNVGIVCRYTDYGWYEFITTSGGYYSIMRYYEDGNKELARGGIKSIRFGTDKKNVYTAICKGRTLILEVNGVEIAKVKDEEIPDAGYVGINISSERVTPVKVEVNWLQISQPD
jgi:hypothetical protein